MVVVASIIAVILSILSLCCAWIVLAVFLSILYLVNLYIKCSSNNSTERSLVLEKYYEAYYYVQQNSQNKDIPIMEGQVAFLQSMTIPISVSYNAGKCSKFYELWHPPPNLYGVYWNLSDCV